MDIRLIAMDMDGTLLDSKKRISQENARALNEANERGIHLAICSGRMVGDAGVFAEEAGLKNCSLLTLNGAYCTHEIEGEPFVNHCMTTEMAEQVTAIMHREKLTFTCYAQNTRLTYEYDRSITWDPSFMHGGHPKAPVVLHGAEGYEQMRRCGFNKIACLSPDPARLQALKPEFEAIPGLCVTSSGSRNLEMMAKGCDKGTAVKTLAEKLGLTAEQVMVFGDYENDVDMFRYAGWPVAMGNGCESIRRMAKLITLTNDEDGIAWAIRRYIFGE